MIRFVPLLALLTASTLQLATAVSAQPPSSVTNDLPAVVGGDPALAPTADAFRDDLRLVTNVVATAALVHDASGAFPATPFALLGSTAARRTALRSTPLSALAVEIEGDRAVYEIVPLPVAPYVREDEVVRVVVYRGDDGLYRGDYVIRRREAPADGGSALPYDRAGHYLVTRGYGTACVDVETVRQRLAAGSYAPVPGSLSAEGLTVRVHPTGEAEPVVYREGRVRDGGR